MIASRRTKRSRLLTVVGIGSVAFIAAACGSSGGSASTPQTTVATTGSGGTGTTVGGYNSGSHLGKATGTPIKLGFINQNAGSVQTDPEDEVAADATVKYINEQLNGVDGHPIVLDKCVTDGTAATSQKCAQQMVADKPLFVIGGVDDNAQAWYSILEPAGLYVLGGTPLTTKDFVTTDALNWSGGDATQLSALPAYVNKYLPNAKNIGILTINLPGALSSLPLIQKPLEARGVHVKTVVVPSSQTNWLSQYISVEHEDAILLLPVQQDCITVAQSQKSQNSKTPVVTVGTCNDASVFKAVGSAMDGWTIPFYGNDPNGSTAEASLYRYVVHTYGNANANLGGFAPTTYSNIMTDYLQLMKPLGYTNLTVANILKKAKSPQGGTVSLFGSHFDCSGQLPFKAICGYQVNFFDFKGSGLVNPRPFISVIPALKAAGVG